jgi:hypothetical protein
MPRGDERREWIPVVIATIVLAIGTFFMWSDIHADARSVADDAITTAAVTRAGATMIASPPPTGLVVPETRPVSVAAPAGRAMR